VNLLTKLIEHNKNRPNKMALQYFKKGNLYSLTWSQVYDRVEQIFNSLNSLGIKPGERVAIYANTCKEWGFIDLAVMACGAVTVPVYHSSHPDDVQVIVDESAPRILFVENEALFKTLQSLPCYQKISTVVGINEFKSDQTELQWLNNISSTSPGTALLSEAEANIKLENLATIIYTSGTSGRPKGVCLHHQQVMSSVADVFPLLGVTHTDKTLSFLPFSHVLGRMELWGHYFCGYTIGYAESIDKIKHNLLQIKPTVIVGVPRIFEKIYFGIKSQIEISKLKESIFNQAIAVGKQIKSLREQKKTPSLLLAMKSQLAHQLVFSNIQRKLGGNLRFAISGGAPLDPDIADVFSACGIQILEGYGLTESTAPIFINTLFENKNGYVGKAIGDVEIRFDDDGEILIRSKKIMKSYYKNEAATQEVMTEDGFFRTGDIGELNEDGFLKITDRKKDLIKTAGGKFIAPQKLQNLFATDPLVDHIHIHGDKKKYVVALITLEKSRVLKLAEKHQISSTDFSQLTRSGTIHSEVRNVVARINSGLASFETIKQFKILDHEFTIKDGQLTPSLKMKRKVIDTLYTKELSDLYN